MEYLKLTLGGAYLLSVIASLFGMVGVIILKGRTLGCRGAKVAIVINHVYYWGVITLNAFNLFVGEHLTTKLFGFFAVAVSGFMYWNMDEHQDIKGYRKIILDQAK